jgi:hypothetical protein
MAGKTRLTDRHGYEQGMQNYANSFGGRIEAFFKPFTTLFTAIGVPHYRKSVYATGSIAPSGMWFTGADSSGLNPFGNNTLSEGIIHSSGSVTDIEGTINPGFVRTFGLKTPQNIVGVGFDQFGYPTPNTNQSWDVSGTFSPTAPNNFWATSGFSPVSHLKDVPYSLWQAGPWDLRWDVNRKVWSSPQSVYSARILAAYSSGSLAPSGTPVFPSTLTYDAIIYDGLANRIKVTGVYSLAPQPIRNEDDVTQNTYKKHPLASGATVLIVHTEISGKPGYGIYMVEEPGTFDCGTSDVATSLFVAPEGNLSLSSLVANPLETIHGGVGFTTYSAYDILVGDLNGSGDLQRLNLVAGTGLALVATTGTLQVRIASGVNFTLGSGVNTSITELQGLTTPLTIGQGGTGSSVKNFIDLGSNQSASGYKYFSDGIRTSSGTASAPGFANNNAPSFGMYFPDTDTVSISTSGTRILDCSYSSGIRLNATTYIRPISLPPEASGSQAYGSLLVQQSANAFFGANPLQIWRSTAGTDYGRVDCSGSFYIRSINIAASGYSVSGTLINIQSPSGFIGSTISAVNSSGQQYFALNSSGTSLKMGINGNQTEFLSPSGNRIINLASGYTGTVSVLASGISSVVTRQLSFIHGMFVGYTDI